jgi:hypothetical protein
MCRDRNATYASTCAPREEGVNYLSLVVLYGVSPGQSVTYSSQTVNVLTAIKIKHGID